MPRKSLPPFRENEAGESVQSPLVLRDPRFSQSLERGLAILGCYSPETPVLGIAQLADRLRMSRSTTHRYVITLVALGYLEQVTPGRQYRLTLGATRLGMGVMNAVELREHAMPLLLELSVQAGFTASLAVLDGSVVQYIDRIRNTRSGRPQQPLVALDLAQAAHITALGKLLLAYLPDPVHRDALRELTLFKAGPKAITNKQQFAGELRKIREDGIATEDEELMVGLVAIAAPVRNYAHEVVAAVGLSANRSVIEMEALADQLSPHLIATADRISARLGFRRADEPHHALGDLYGPAFEGHGT
ncbi:MAG TPA: IclR family transcriptional regulator [Solirubrobacteraceae bacterium]